MALHYTTWQDAWQYLGPELGAPDTERLEGTFLADAEAAFDVELSIRFDVPFSEALHPEAFDVAKNVCGRRAAAEYVRWANRIAGGTDSPRRAVELDEAAEVWMARLKTPLVPADAPAADSPQVLIPYDGGGAARETSSFFKRGRVTPGSPTHY